ncbi:hypothetical protein N7476_007489 [Penicillium atrosanguineum]|uniref:Uncharacterized protein n=1 Tax=Penicillium atrosanguineum TaxID=1132637 RepID=A0A9W9PUK9_9EURO|nr:hypothetical protein N7476_007489 [Penicillium atrosanguineum]
MSRERPQTLPPRLLQSLHFAPRKLRAIFNKYYKWKRNSSTESPTFQNIFTPSILHRLHAQPPQKWQPRKKTPTLLRLTSLKALTEAIRNYDGKYDDGPAGLITRVIVPSDVPPAPLHGPRQDTLDRAPRI